VKRTLPLSRVYRVLERGPVLLVTTARAGRANVMPLSWQTMIDFEPPLVGIVMSDRNWSWRALDATGECVLNVPTVELARAVVGCGNCSGERVDKFRRYRLTPRPAKVVAPPLLDECWASLECRVVDRRLVRRYGLYVLEVVQAWHDPAVRRPRTLHHLGHGSFMVAGELIKLRSAKA
jgi:flavin reductase (DIM6/NTAB) family NADH-FMN oxidoreductase RutF